MPPGNPRLRKDPLYWLVLVVGVVAQIVDQVTESSWGLVVIGPCVALLIWMTRGSNRVRDEVEAGRFQVLTTSERRRRWFSRGEIPPVDPQRVWLTPLDFRIVFPLVAVAFLAASFYPFHGIDQLRQDPLTTVAIAVAAIYVGVIAFRNRLELHADGLYVWTLTRVRRLPIADIADIRSGDNGLDVTMRNGQIVTTWLIGEKVRPRRKRRTRADRLADEVRALVIPNMA